jgi:putative aldouronate transport system substrate-binding protein
VNASSSAPSRRTLLKACAATVASVWLSSACAAGTGPGGGSAGPTRVSSQPSSSGRVKLPTFRPIQGPKPDLPASADGVIEPGYRTYPKDLFTSVKSTPGDGSDVTAFVSLGALTGLLPADQNPAWQAVNKALGVNMKISAVAFADYLTTKLNTVIASGDLPDLLSVLTANPGLQQPPEFYQSQCTDLTDFLSGDAVKDYPNLANLPTRSWRGTVFNNRIFGVPQILRPFFWWQWVHQELLDQDGLAQPKNTTELKDQLVHFTRPQQNFWGTATEIGNAYAWGLLNGLWTTPFGAPNNWAVDNSGRFTSMFDSDAFKAATGYARDLFAAGVFHPKSTQYTTTTARVDFEGRQFAYRFDGLDLAYWDNPAKLSNPDPAIRMVAPFAADGVKPVYYYGPGDFGITVLKKTAPDRARMLLRVLDYLAAPFGSQEYELLFYGVRGTDFNYDDQGNPRYTDKGRQDLLPWAGIMRPSIVLYDANFPGYADLIQGYEKVLQPIAIEDPSDGLFAPSLGHKGVAALQSLGDGLSDIVTGRRALADFDQLVKDWHANGGDQLKTEYEQAYAAAR